MTVRADADNNPRVRESENRRTASGSTGASCPAATHDGGLGRAPAAAHRTDGTAGSRGTEGRDRHRAGPQGPAGREGTDRRLAGRSRDRSGPPERRRRTAGRRWTARRRRTAGPSGHPLGPPVRRRQRSRRRLVHDRRSERSERRHRHRSIQRHGLPPCRQRHDRVLRIDRRSVDGTDRLLPRNRRLLRRPLRADPAARASRTSRPCAARRPSTRRRSTRPIRCRCRSVAFEHFDADDDATLPGACTPMAVVTASLGVVTTATDPALGSLALPLRLK